MKIFERITMMLAMVGPLSLGACTGASTSGSVRIVEPSAYSAGVPTTTDAPVLSGTSTDHGDTFVLPPEPGFNPDDIAEAP
jgi:hypothetical protein